MKQRRLNHMKRLKTPRMKEAQGEEAIKQPTNRSRTWRCLSRIGEAFDLLGTASALDRVMRVGGALAQLEQLAQLVAGQHRRVELALRSGSAPHDALAARLHDTHLCIHQILQPLFGKLPLVHLRLHGQAKSVSAGAYRWTRIREPSPRWCRCSGSGTRTRAFSGRRATRARPPACRLPGSSRGRTAPSGFRR